MIYSKHILAIYGNYIVSNAVNIMIDHSKPPWESVDDEFHGNHGLVQYGKANPILGIYGYIYIVIVYIYIYPICLILE